MLSDIVVTYGDAERTERPVKSRLGQLTTQVYRHARKLHIISDRTCVTAAGDANQIARFLDDLKGNILAFEQQERPARHISELANTYHGIQVLASFAKQTPAGIAENHSFHVGANSVGGRAIHYRSDVFGMVKVSGCGGGALHKLVSSYEGPAKRNLDLTRVQLERRARTEHAHLNENEIKSLVELEGAGNISLALCEGITTQYLVNEINAFERPGHGGFFEYAMFDPFKNRWRFRPSAIYCIFNLHVNDDDRVTDLELVEPIFIYQSRPEGGFINVVTGNNSVFHVCTPHDVRDQNWTLSNPFFLPWTPERVVFCFVEKKRNGHLSYLVSRVLNPPELKFVTYTYNEGGFSFSVDMEWLRWMIGLQPSR